MRKIASVLIGIAVGAFISFINSYSYAISGYTTSEISIVWVPIIILFIFNFLKLDYSAQDIVIAVATAIGIDITTTLTSGMYITFGFLKYVSSRLKAFGFEIDVPKYLFDHGKNLLDFHALPTYVSLAIISLGGAFIAYSLRMHFFDKERLRFPVAVASATITHTLKNAMLGKDLLLLLFFLGFALQTIYFVSGLSIDLTPIVSSVLPGAVFALSFSPLLFALFMLLPLGSLRSFSIGSLLMYLILIPIAIKLFDVPILPSQGYDDMLFMVSPIVLSYNVGFVIVFLLFYIIIYWSQLVMSLSIILKFNVEKTVFTIGLLHISLLGIVAALFATTFASISYITFLAIVLVLFLHIILVIGNLRVVGESGTGSQALFPLVTMTMYLLGVRNITLYAMLDPYTGIPMPQVVASTTMNLLRYSRLSKTSAIDTLKHFCFGVFIGGFITYAYGNILVTAYGFNSPQMPLSRWIPTVVWMAAIYQGKLTNQSINTVFLSILIAVIVIALSRLINLPIFPFLVGITLPPDIGIQALIAYIVKVTLIRFGPAFHEKVIMGSTIFVLGAAVAFIINTVLMLIGVNIA